MKARELAELLNEWKRKYVLNGEFLFKPDRFVVLLKNEIFLKLGGFPSFLFGGDWLDWM
jgi:hypothetical protein